MSRIDRCGDIFMHTCMANSRLHKNSLLFFSASLSLSVTQRCVCARKSHFAWFGHISGSPKASGLFLCQACRDSRCAGEQVDTSSCGRGVHPPLQLPQDPLKPKTTQSHERQRRHGMIEELSRKRTSS